jgi:hypothetical protein
MFRLPHEIIVYVYEFDSTYREIYQKSLNHIQYLRSQYIKNWYEKKFKMKDTVIMSLMSYGITLFDHKKIVKILFQEINTQFMITFYNVRTGSWKYYSIPIPSIMILKK